MVKIRGIRDRTNYQDENSWRGKQLKRRENGFPLLDSDNKIISDSLCYMRQLWDKKRINEFKNEVDKLERRFPTDGEVGEAIIKITNGIMAEEIRSKFTREVITEKELFDLEIEFKD